MQVQPVAFSANGQVGTAGFTANIISPLSGGAFAPAYDGDVSSVAVPAMPQRLVGFGYTGFTKVVFYNGTDNSGDVVAVGGAAGSYSFSYEINCQRGLYVEVTGSGKGTVWLA